MNNADQGSLAIPEFFQPSDDLEPHKQEVARLAYTLFARLDEKIGGALGFKGSILEEMYQRRGKNGQSPIDTNGLDPAISRFVRGSSFFIELPARPHQVHPHYEINCGLGLHPKIQVPTNDGSFNFDVLTGPTGREFHTVRIVRYYNDAQGDFSHAREVTTFSDNFHIGQPDTPLRIEERLRDQRKVSVAYSTITDDGTVTLEDQQRIMILPDSPGVDGIYHVSTNAIAWSQHSWNLDKPSVKEDPGYLMFTHRGDTWSFPKQTNIYEELRNITANSESLPEGDLSLP